MEDDFSFIFSYDLSGGQESWYHDVIKGKLPILVRNLRKKSRF